MEALPEIGVDCLESVHARYNNPEWGEDPEKYPPGRLNEFEALYHGRAVLTLPGGKRYWLPVIAGEVKANIAAPMGHTLLSAVLDHNAIADHSACEVFFERSTNALTSVFCTKCGRFVDLTEDVRKMDEEGTRKP